MHRCLTTNLLLPEIPEIGTHLRGIKLTDRQYTDIPSIQEGNDFLDTPFA
jgi:hypothetical protein